MNAKVPSLIVQPLLENAVYHGIEPLSNGGIITVTGKYQNQIIELSIENPISNAAHSDTHLGHGIALDNIQQRLQLAWPNQAEVYLRHTADSYCVVLRFPYQP